MHRIVIVLFGTLWATTAAVAKTDPQIVIVFPLYGTPDSESIAWVGEGIAASLSDQLRGPMVNVMDSGQVAELMEDMGFLPGVQPSRGSMISIAQKASADLVVMGSFEGTEKNLAVSARVFYLEELKLSGRIAANGPLAALPQMENELAWQVLTEIGVEKSASREKYYERTRQIPNSAFALYIQSLSAPSENDKRRLLLKAVDILSKFPEAQFQLGMLYYRKSECKNALRHLVLADIEDDVPMAGLFTIGACYTQTNQLPLAIETYSRILRDSRPFEVLNNLGVVYLRRSENSLALNSFNEAHGLAPDESTISLNLAIALQIQGNTSLARSTVEDAIEVNAKNGMLHFLLGFLLKDQGEVEKADSALQEAANLGVAIKKLIAQDPKTWAQVFLNWPSSKKQSTVDSTQSAVR